MIEAACRTSRPAGITKADTVLVFRALNLGDMLCAVPALRALRANLPRTRICLLGLPWARRFSARFSSYIDEFIEFPGFPGLPEQACREDRLAFFLDTMQQRKFDLAIQMHGSGIISNTVVASLGARITAGFFTHGQACPDPRWYAPYPETMPEVRRNLVLIRLLGFHTTGEQLEFPIFKQDAEELSRIEELRELRPRTYACIHPGASKREKCWPIERFSAVAGTLRKQGLTVVVTGDYAESDLAARIVHDMDGGCIDAASPGLGLGSLALLIRNARLLVCNDTGVSHIASALRVPSVVVFTLADPARWAPLDAFRHRAVGRIGGLPSVDEVLLQAASLLKIKDQRRDKIA